jgi:3-phenylpropionate/trans-cinnamate dioxygenase ferredoxin component
MTQSESLKWIVVAALEDVSMRRIVPIRVQGHDLILIQNGDSFWACQRLCPHEYADLAQGRIAGTQLFCGRHFASFDLKGGTSGNGWQLPELKVYPARAHNGNIEVDAAAIAANPPIQRRRLAPERPSQGGIDPAPPKKT